MKRLKTISKHFFNDEILGVMSNGDILLKMGVKRKNYSKSDFEVDKTEHINFSALYHDKWINKVKSYTDIDGTGSERDNWED